MFDTSSKKDPAFMILLPQIASHNRNLLSYRKYRKLNTVKQMIRLVIGVILEVVAFVFIGVEVVFGKTFSGSESETFTDFEELLVF